MTLDRSLNSLHAEFRPLAVELIARLVEADIAVRIINTLRTEQEQNVLRAQGRSWVRRSRHQDGMAIDLCPYGQWDAHGVDKLNWDGTDQVWQMMGEVGEELGLVWGGRWTVRDLGHFELPRTLGGTPT